VPAGANGSRWRRERLSAGRTDATPRARAVRSCFSSGSITPTDRPHSHEAQDGALGGQFGRLAGDDGGSADESVSGPYRGQLRL
jgi:hypothetical protein